MANRNIIVIIETRYRIIIFVNIDSNRRRLIHRARFPSKRIFAMAVVVS